MNRYLDAEALKRGDTMKTRAWYEFRREPAERTCNFAGTTDLPRRLRVSALKSDFSL